MARRGNNRNGKKLRHYTGVGIGMTKHYVSGHASINRRDRMLDARASNASAAARGEQKKRRKPEMHATVAEAFKKK